MVYGTRYMIQHRSLFFSSSLMGPGSSRVTTCCSFTPHRRRIFLISFEFNFAFNLKLCLRILDPPPYRFRRYSLRGMRSCLQVSNESLLLFCRAHDPGSIVMQLPHASGNAYVVLYTFQTPYFDNLQKRRTLLAMLICNEVERAANLLSSADSINNILFVHCLHDSPVCTNRLKVDFIQLSS